ncbi:hypothetical protein ACQJBY_061109 [Aegilops geniculata]
MWWPDDYDDLHACLRCNATLLCAKDRCDHLDCHGGPFRLAFVGCDYTGRAAHAAVYSSETREWTDVTSVEHEHYIHYTGHSAVVGDKVYVPCMESDSLIVYNMGEGELSVINPPFLVQAITLMGVEDGMHWRLVPVELRDGSDTGSSSSNLCSLLLSSWTTSASSRLVLLKVLVSFS